MRRGQIPGRPNDGMTEWGRTQHGSEEDGSGEEDVSVHAEWFM